MMPEAKASLVRARADLDEARTVAALPLAGLAARSAYYAAFHAAEAFIVDRTGRRAKTHRGVHTEFARLTKDGSADDRKMVRTLIGGYRYKERADYSIDPAAVITNHNATEMIDAATRFVACVTELLSTPPATDRA